MTRVPTADAPLNHGVASRLVVSRNAAWVLAFANLALGLVVVVLWLVRPGAPGDLPALLLMKANTAMCIAGASTGLALILRGGRIEIACARFLGAFVLVVSALTFLEYAVDANLGLDLAIAGDPSSSFPGRMAPPTTLAMQCIGLALVLHPLRSRRAVLACDAAIVAAFVVGLVVIAAYLYDAPTLYGRTPLTRTSPQTAAALLTLCLGLALARTDAGLMKLAVGPGPGSLAIRWLLPVFVIVPIVLGSLRTWAQRAGLVSTPEGLTFVVVSQIVVLGVVAFAFAVQLNRARAAYEDEKRKREEIESFVTMCAWTKQVKLGGEWVSVERYLKDHFGISITHGISQEALADQLKRLDDEELDEDDADEPT